MQRTMSHTDPVFLLNNPTMRALVGALFALGRCRSSVWVLGTSITSSRGLAYNSLGR